MIDNNIVNKIAFEICTEYHNLLCDKIGNLDIEEHEKVYATITCLQVNFIHEITTLFCSMADKGRHELAEKILLDVKYKLNKILDYTIEKNILPHIRGEVDIFKDE